MWTKISKQVVGASLILTCVALPQHLFAQTDLILLDHVVATVGAEIIMRSDVESQAQQLYMQGMAPKSKETTCEVVEDMILQKLLLSQARKDSLTANEEEVNNELNRRIQYFVMQIGTIEKLEAFLGKSIAQIKEEFRTAIHDQLLVRNMQQSIIGKARVTPSDVRDYFLSIPKDSLPYIPSEVQIGQIVIYPKLDSLEINRVKNLLNQIREDVIAGSKFSLKARVYSEDKGSAINGGELGLLKREDLVPEFAGAAFSLKENEVSPIVETQYGYHIIQLVEKRGELANFRHILVKPKVSSLQLSYAEARLDTIKQLITATDSLTFKQAVEIYSMDEDTKNNYGLMINPSNGGSIFSVNDLDATIYQGIERLKVGEMSAPQVFETPDGKMGVRILYLYSKTEPHVADLQQDYQKIMAAALQQQQNILLQEWVEKKKSTIFLKIDPEFENCNFIHNWQNTESKE